LLQSKHAEQISGLGTGKKFSEQQISRISGRFSGQIYRENICSEHGMYVKF